MLVCICWTGRSARAGLNPSGEARPGCEFKWLPHCASKTKTRKEEEKVETIKMKTQEELHEEEARLCEIVNERRTRKNARLRESRARKKEEDAAAAATAAAVGNAHQADVDEAMRPQPKRQLSAFNLFYRYKRRRILHYISKLESSSSNNVVDRDAIIRIVGAVPGLEGAEDGEHGRNDVVEYDAAKGGKGEEEDGIAVYCIGNGVVGCSWVLAPASRDERGR